MFHRASSCLNPWVLSLCCCFGIVMEHLGGMAILEEAHHLVQAWKVLFINLIPTASSSLCLNKLTLKCLLWLSPPLSSPHDRLLLSGTISQICSSFYKLSWLWCLITASEEQVTNKPMIQQYHS